MKIVKKAFRNPYIQWTILLMVFGFIMGLGIYAILLEEGIFNK